jgi:hypothetical protein
VGIVRRDSPDLVMDGERDLDEFVERRRVVRRASKRDHFLELSPHAFFSLTITSIAAIRVPSGGVISISGNW